MTNLFQIFCTTQRGYDPSKYPKPPIVSAEPSRGHEWPVPLSLLDHKIPQTVANLTNFAEDFGKGLYSLSVRVPLPTPPGHLGLKRGSGDFETARASSEFQLVSDNSLFSFPVCHLRGSVSV